MGGGHSQVPSTAAGSSSRRPTPPGMVHFSVFFRYMEEAEHAVWRRAGMDIFANHEEHSWPRISAALRLQGAAQVPGRIRGAHRDRPRSRRSTIQWAHVIMRGESVIGTGTVTAVYVAKNRDGSMKSAEIPAAITSTIAIGSAGTRFLSHFQIDRAIITIRIRIADADAERDQRKLQRDEAQADHERVFGEAQEPVAERLGTGVGRDARAGLRHVTARRRPRRPAARSAPVMAGDASPSDATAISAPPTGRISVCTESQIESTHGILSATNSTT